MNYPATGIQVQWMQPGTYFRWRLPHSGESHVVKLTRHGNFAVPPGGAILSPEELGITPQTEIGFNDILDEPV